jgi:protocatechuate 3,4-dioxygenase beta subunit
MAIALVTASPLIPQAPVQPETRQLVQVGGQPDVSPPAPGRITGTVYVQGTTNLIAGVTVNVNIPAAPRGRGADGTPLAFVNPLDFTTKTDSEGHFSIDNVPAGNRNVVALLEGYFGPAQNGSYPANARSQVMVVSAKTAEVKLELIPGGAISGHVYNADGTPVTDALVQVLRLTYQDGQQILQPNLSKTTDDRGEYRIYRLSPGSYYIAVNPKQPGGPQGAGAAVLAVKTFYPDTSDPSRAIAATIHGGDEVSGVNMTVRMEAGATLSGQIVTSLPASGQLVGPRGQTRDFTVMNSTLTLSPHDRRTSLTNFSRSIGVSMPAPNSGKFEIRNVPPGTYDLIASLPDATGWGSQQPAGLATQPVGYGRTVVEVIGGRDIQGISVNVHAGVDIKGRISVNGGSQNVQNIRLRLQPDDSAATLAVYQQVSQYQPYVDENGNFSIPAVPEGRYRIQIMFADGPVANDGRGGIRGQRGPGGAQSAPAGGQRGRGAQGETAPARVENPLNAITAFVESIRQGSADVYDNGLSVTAQSAGELDVRIGTGPGIIQGTVFDLSQNPVASTGVFLVPTGERRANMQLYRGTQSDTNGKFTMNGVVPGQYQLYSWQDVVQGAYQNEEYRRRYEGRGTNVSVTRSATVTVEVRRIPSEKP